MGKKQALLPVFTDGFLQGRPPPVTLTRGSADLAYLSWGDVFSRSVCVISQLKRFALVFFSGAHESLLLLESVFGTAEYLVV